MTVLIDSEGHKCDARCYDAKRLGCSCVCGGKNHGLGLQHAVERAEEAEVEANRGAREQAEWGGER